jgi:hypothetical protein
MIYVGTGQKKINFIVFSSCVFRKEKFLFGFGSQFSQLADKSMLTVCAGQPFRSRATATQHNSPSLRDGNDRDNFVESLETLSAVELQSWVSF